MQDSVFHLSNRTPPISENLPNPEVLAAEIVEKPRNGVRGFRSIYEELREKQTKS